MTACEVNPKRRARLVENLARLKLDVDVIPAIPSISLQSAFAKATADKPATRNSQLFSKILVDAPCSNTGVFRRRPDARWNWSVEKLASLTKLQSEILDSVVPLLAPGGTLVYSTCSNEPEENGGTVEAFLARHPDFTLAESSESVPFESGHDGAFAAALVLKI